ncbi:histidine phosphatase superfamily [Obelidium mucronatum]|nr:histidine phosphatase superfamily [Obelidium mucronatum]
MTPRPRSVYILRHGIRQDFVSAHFVSPTGRVQDPPLSEAGLQQAAALGAFLGGRRGEHRIRHVFSSPFSRCVQTAQPAAAALGLAIRIEPGVGEWFKPGAAAAHVDAPSPAEVAAGLALRIGSGAGEIDAAYEPLVRAVGTETPAQIHARFAAVVRALVARLDAAGRAGDGDVLIATHAAGVIAAVRGLLAWSNAPVVAGVATFCKLTRTDAASGAWKAEVNGEQSHLADLGGLLYNWEFPGAYAPVGTYEDLLNPPPLTHL